MKFKIDLTNQAKFEVMGYCALDVLESLRKIPGINWIQIDYPIILVDFGIGRSPEKFPEYVRDATVGRCCLKRV